MDCGRRDLRLRESLVHLAALLKKDNGIMDAAWGMFQNRKGEVVKRFHVNHSVRRLDIGGYHLGPVYPERLEGGRHSPAQIQEVVERGPWLLKGNAAIAARDFIRGTWRRVPEVAHRMYPTAKHR